MTSTTLFSDVVLPAATWYEKHDLNTTDMHPFVHSFNPAIAPPWQTRTDWDAWQTIAATFSELAADAPRRPHATSSRCRCCTTPPTRWPPRTAWSATGRPASASRCPGVTMPKLVEVERDYGAVAAKMAALGPLMDTPRRDDQGRHLRRGRAGRLPARTRTAPSAAGAGRRPAARWPATCTCARRSSRCPAPPTATWPPRASRRWRSAPAPGWPTWPPSTRASRSPSPTPRRAPVPVITSPEWSGSETGGRRYSPFTINVERLKPWHTLTGRQHFFLDHDWMAELGEGLPVYRPPLNMTALFAEPRDRRRRASSAITRALPDPAQQVVDPLGVPGQPVHAVALPRRPDDLDERPRTRPRSGSRTTTGSRRSTATASWSPGRSCRTGCPRARSTCTTRRTG